MSKKIIIITIGFVTVLFMGILYFVLHWNTQLSAANEVPSATTPTRQLDKTPPVEVPTNHKPEEHTD